MFDYELVRATLAAVLRPGDAFADLFAEQSTYVLYTATNGESSMRTRVEQGVGIRRVESGHTVSRHVHAPELSEETLGRLARSLRDEENVSRPPRCTAPAVPPVDIPYEALQRLVKETTTEAQRAPGTQFQAQATASVRAVWRTVLVASSDGRVCLEERAYATLQVEVVIRHERKVRKSRRFTGASRLTDLWQDHRHLLLAREASENALYQMEAVPAPSGEMAVILGPGGPAVLLHEACGHALEADLALQTGAAYHGCLGERVAAPAITLIDDPAPSHGAALYHIDDEGSQAEPTILIEQGILRNYLYDRCRAAPGQTSNGHARRLSYAYPPLPRMSTTYVAPGRDSAEEILAGTKKGILVRSILGGDTDMGSGRFNLQVEEGYLVENGRVIAPIGGAMLSGHGPQVLRSIDRVGNDCQFLNYGYTCNKLDQFPLVVSVGQPTLRVSQLYVWGGERYA